MPASYINQCLADMRTVAQTGRWTLEAQIYAYDLLDVIAGLESASDLEIIRSFCNEYDTLAPALEAAFDEQQLRAALDERLKPLKDAVASAERQAEKMTDLHECAKETFNIWQKDGMFARHRALRILRKKAGFRLEYKRIGNYVAKTFDLMNEARSAYARAQQALFAADVSYKIRPGIYPEIRERLGSLLSENNPLVQ